MAASQTLNLYDTTLGMMINSLKNLSHVLDKGQKHLQAKDLPDSTFFEARIIQDMNPFPFQIQTACNSAKFTAVRVGGASLPSIDDNEKTLDDLQKRIGATLEMLNGVPRESFDGAESKEFEFLGRKWTGLTYCVHFAVPNFFFHVGCAYMILRANGVDIGKLDYIMGPGAAEAKK